jgi:hypothetical protein
LKVSSEIQSAPKDTPHKLEVSAAGGHAIVISLPELEFYLFKVGELLVKGQISYEEESSTAKKYGQVFLDNIEHLS